MSKSRFCVYFLAMAMLSIHSTNVIAAKNDCPNPKGSTNGGSERQFGPYDYRDPTAKAGPLELVETYHFTIDVATLTHGASSTLAGDLDYTLRAFPNHHRALQSLADLGIREKSTKIADMHYSVPCYFSRAINYTPTDGLVNALYAYYLSNFNQNEMAILEAENGIKKNPKVSKIYYLAALTYHKAGNQQKSYEYALMAKKLGSTIEGLDRLLHNAPATK